jgi:hypothetical protein
MTSIDKIKKILTSEFELELFEASLSSLKDSKNKLRYNNFAYSIRELSRHFLHSLSPEELVKNCPWYKSETTNASPSRTQRIKYAIQGGISDDMLTAWGLDLSDLENKIRVIKATIDSLSRYTHINSDVFNLKDAEIDRLSNEVLSVFGDFVETIDNYRNHLNSFLDEHIEGHMIESALSNFFENVDRLAPHHSLDYISIYDYHISEITNCEIIVRVSGRVHVTLEYGSNKERREGDGLDLKESFPYQTKIKYEIDADFPTTKYDVEDYDVDTSEWYGESEEDY